MTRRKVAKVVAARRAAGKEMSGFEAASEEKRFLVTADLPVTGYLKAEAG